MCRLGGYHCAGRLAEVVFWHRALDDYEVVSLALSGWDQRSERSGAAAYYPLEEVRRPAKAQHSFDPTDPHPETHRPEMKLRTLPTIP
jgi:hypothetical protein